MKQRCLVSKIALPLALGVCLLGLLPAPQTFAAGVVSTASEASLRAALAGGGTVTFSVSGTIVLTSPLEITNATIIDGAGQQVTLSGGGSNRILTVKSAASLDLKRVALIDGNDTVGGLDNGSYGAGGAIFAAGKLTISGCTFSNNTASAQQPRAGAVLFDSSSGLRKLVVTDSTFVNNHAEGYGAIFSRASYQTNGVSITNCTFAGNLSDWATVTTVGPALGAPWIVNCTFANNTNTVSPGVIYHANPETLVYDEGLHVINSLFASNTAPGGGKIIDRGHNLVSGPAGVLTNVTTVANTDPLLAPLADNGGPTWTMALQAGSPALEAAQANGAPLADQRGILRLKGQPDIGAFEGTQPSGGTLVRFAANDFQVGEAGVLGAVWIERIGPSSGSSSVDFSATAGTAVNGTDFYITNITVNFAPGEAVKTVYVPVLDDGSGDGNKTVVLTLANPVSATLTSPSTATLTILDNESAQNLAECTYVGVFNAISNGGWYKFDCDAFIHFPAMLTVISNTVLDANGHNVIFDGNFTSRLLTVNNGRTLTLKNIFLTRGNYTSPDNNFPVSDGPAGEAGALIVQNATLNLVDCRVTTNRVQGGYGRGGPSGRGPAGRGGHAYGGAIVVRNGTLNATRTLFGRNQAVGGTAGHAQEIGGSGSQGGQAVGGAIWSQDSVVTLEDCDFVNNLALGGNGDDWQFNSSAYDGFSGGALGGAIASSNGLVTIRKTLFQSNRATSGRGFRGQPDFGSQVYGGGVYLQGNASVVNSTFWANFAEGGNGNQPGRGALGYGGALFVAGGTVDLINVTAAFNSASAGSNSLTIGQGGHLAMTNGTLQLANTLLGTSWGGTNVVGTITDLGHNLSSDGSAAFTAAGSLNSTDPLLGPLADNGGPTYTMALLSGSPALDAGDDAAAPATDQRGLLRPFGAHSDIGAYEGATPFVLQGRVSGLSNEVQVIVNSSTLTTTNGWFGLVGQAAGAYTVTPTNAGYVFVPASRTVTLGPDQPRVDFTAYEDNSLTLEGYSSGFLEMTYAGKQAQQVRVLVSTNGTDWTPLSTHSVNTNKVLQLAPPLTDGTRFYRTERVQ